MFGDAMSCGGIRSTDERVQKLEQQVTSLDKSLRDAHEEAFPVMSKPNHKRSPRGSIQSYVPTLTIIIALTLVVSLTRT